MHEHEPDEVDDGNGALTKDNDYYASKSGSRQDGGDGGHARRRLDELLSQRGLDQRDAEEEPDKESKGEPSSAEQEPSPSEGENPDKGAPDEG